MSFDVGASFIGVNEISTDESLKDPPFGDGVVLGGRALKVV
jgi:hypothetical protein